MAELPQFFFEHEHPSTVVVGLRPVEGDGPMHQQVYGQPYMESDIRLAVEFGTDADGNATDTIVCVTYRNPDGLSANALRDFAWSRWLRAATAEARMAFAFSLDNRDAAWQSRREVADIESLPPPGARPGKRGHPREHYEWVADRYEALSTAGSQKPVALIAEERSVSPNTASAWVRRCRELGLLPPARHGKAG